jgi:hypothetical protein
MFLPSKTASFISLIFIFAPIVVLSAAKDLLLP